MSLSDSIKHTPGPWVWRGKSASLHRVGAPPYAYGTLVLAPEYEHDSGVGTKVSDADAALIAAAPDMLEALEAASVWITQAPHDDLCFTNDPNHDACRCVCGKATALNGISSAIAKAEGLS